MKGVSITINGQGYASISAAARDLVPDTGINAVVLRLRRGWSIADAFELSEAPTCSHSRRAQRARQIRVLTKQGWPLSNIISTISNVEPQR